MDLISGELIGAYVLYSKSYIPDRAVEKIDKLSAAMVESGLFQFYISIKKYKEKLYEMNAYVIKELLADLLSYM